ncbi:MAG TPA: hypothetical protein DCE13_07810 [Cryomorphaceae bacterium]|jgi:hypothetical protein|nr:MAG: hypothetical protein ABR87_02560 [Cryomorphaceae bacterium BACL7 MAG-121220-bin83]HAB32434.1 hypothetical protein [Cryomorphaceae bacterium]
MNAAFSLYLELGFYHIVDRFAWDHLLFILALIAPIPLKAWKPWLGALSAFTVGHTLAMAIQALAHIPLNPIWLEASVLGTLVLTAARVVWLKGTHKPQAKLWILAGLFGLIHGAAFWQDFSVMIPPDGLTWELWIGFTSGVELGQLSVVLTYFMVRALMEQLGWSTRDFALAVGAMCLGVALHLAFS